MWRRWMLAGLVAAGSVIVLAAPAGATFTENKIGCEGDAVINGGGKTVSVNANDATIKVPTKGSAAWHGSITTVTHDHFGEVKLKLAMFSIELGSWGKSANSGNAHEKSGLKKIPSAVGQLPAGKYALTGFHQGNEGRCAGHVTVELDTSATGNAVGIVSLAGTALTALLLALSAIAKKGVLR